MIRQRLSHRLGNTLEENWGRIYLPQRINPSPFYTTDEGKTNGPDRSEWNL
jgi:hypothetical protein